MTETPTSTEELQSAQRLDRWLWFARFFKTRTLATNTVTTGKVRVNGERVSRAARAIKPGDVLTFPAGSEIRVIKVLGIGPRRGPAPEAQALYEDQTPRAPQSSPKTTKTTPETREAGSGRPTKRDRRQTDAFKTQTDAFKTLSD